MTNGYVERSNCLRFDEATRQETQMSTFQYVATPHLTGCCVKVQNRVHGLFVVRRRPQPSLAEALPVPCAGREIASAAMQRPMTAAA